MAVTRKVVVGDEKAPDPMGIVLTDRAFEIVGGAEPALTALDVDNRAK